MFDENHGIDHSCQVLFDEIAPVVSVAQQIVRFSTEASWCQFNMLYKN
jgi:hypothetical protein